MSKFSASEEEQQQRSEIYQWLLVLLYLAALLVGTHLPEDNFAVETAILWCGSDKLAHFFGYFGLSVLILATGIAPPTWRGAVYVLVGLAILGAVDELTQPLFDRSDELTDWLADVLGSACGFVVGTLVNQWWLASRNADNSSRV